MNKKSKRITLGLVSALCLLLVVALGFGVTGAWYRARRQATGIVKLDQGIEMSIKNLGATKNANLEGIDGQFWVAKDNGDDGDYDDVEALNHSTVPGDVTYVANPSIAATAESTTFYAKARLFYTFNLSTSFGTNVGGATPTTFTLADLYTDQGTTNATLAGLFGDNQLTWDDAHWKHFGTGSNDMVFYVGSSSATAPAVVPTSDVAFFDATSITALLDEAYTTAPAFAEVRFADWTEAGVNAQAGTGYVEYGGPAVYYNSGTDQDPVWTSAVISAVNFKVVIDVIQSENVGNFDLSDETTTVLETWVNTNIA
jgi:hypothetical protein